MLNKVAAVAHCSFRTAVHSVSELEAYIIFVLLSKSAFAYLKH
jgi:hypothetical protein